MSVSIRVVDGVYGRAAAGLFVTVSHELNGATVDKWRDQAGEDGCIPDLIRTPHARGSYALGIDLEGYFSKLGYRSLFSTVTARFRVADDTRDHALSIIITPASCFAIKAD
jgi:5-hydroxyisourate hydrolase-like protein (transthyretin family)